MFFFCIVAVICEDDPVDEPETQEPAQDPLEERMQSALGYGLEDCVAVDDGAETTGPLIDSDLGVEPLPDDDDGDDEDDDDEDAVTTVTMTDKEAMLSIENLVQYAKNCNNFELVGLLTKSQMCVEEHWASKRVKQATIHSFFKKL